MIKLNKKQGIPFKALVVDDSAFVQKQVSQILTSAGIEILATASDGASAVTRYKELHPEVDFVTMDITMPGMDGITALEKIIEFDPMAKVVMVSALGKEDMVKKALLCGAKNYIVKPLDRQKVLERLTSLLQES